MPSMSSGDLAALQGVSKSYAKRSVLQDFDFALEPGTVTALLGPNGAGKSTIVGLLSGRLSPDAGVIKLFGLDPRHQNARARLGVMLQAAGLPDALTVSEVITLHAGYFKRGLKTTDILDQAGLTALAKRPCDKLSGGEQRRVQFALAIAGAPDLLVLDEPTTGLDVQARHALWRTVREKAANGAAILLATHHMDEAEALADRLVVIADGRIAADGSPAAIKGRVAGTTIRVRTPLGASVLKSLPGVIKVVLRGADASIFSSHARNTLEALFRADPSLNDVDVTAASLEDALASIVEATLKEAA